MNIKFGMDNFYTRYLKRFLNDELQHNNTLLDKFDKNDLELLIKYLNLPNVKDMFTVQKEINELFPDLNRLFNMQLLNNRLKWVSKGIGTEYSDYILDNKEAISEYCESVGWLLGNTEEWVDLTKDVNNDGIVDSTDREIIYSVIYEGATYEDTIMNKCDLNLDGDVNELDLELFDDYMTNGKLSLEIYKSDRENYFPNKDMLIFVNQFTGDFMYNYALRDGVGRDDLPHYDETFLHKIAVYKCKPGQKITIAHNNPDPVRLVIGSSAAQRKQDLRSFVVQNVADITLAGGEYYEYTATSTADGSGYNAHYILIQCPSDYRDLVTTTKKSLILEVGDINFDGKIDMEDYTLLASYTAKGPGSEKYHWNPTAKQLAVMNCDTYSPNITVSDAERLYKFIQGDPTIPSLGVVTFKYEVETETTGIQNVDNLLIIDGHYSTVTNENGVTRYNKALNIPFKEFVDNDWVIHEKFFNYLLKMAVHKYSDSDDIAYVQKLFKTAFPQYIYTDDMFYPGHYSDKFKNLVLDYQKSKTYFNIGDLNRDGIITNTDAQLMIKVIDTIEIIDNIEKYLNGEIVLTPEQILEYDIRKMSDTGESVVGKDGIVDELDLNAWKLSISELRKYADTDFDGDIDSADYRIVEQQILGETDQLTNYEQTFNLGWYDVETDKNFQHEYNIYGDISEVSK